MKSTSIDYILLIKDDIRGTVAICEKNTDFHPQAFYGVTFSGEINPDENEEEAFFREAKDKLGEEAALFLSQNRFKPVQVYEDKEGPEHHLVYAVAVPNIMLKFIQPEFSQRTKLLDLHEVMQAEIKTNRCTNGTHNGAITIKPYHVIALKESFDWLYKSNGRH